MTSPERAPHAREFLRVAEVADLLGVSSRFVWSLLSDQRLRAVRLGRRATRIARADLDAYLATAGVRRSGNEAPRR